MIVMTALLLQTALLLVTAYFAGAFLACIVRRTFFADRVVRAPAEARPVAVAMPQPAAPGPAPAPARRPDPAVAAPRIETVQRAAATAPAEAASRFARALTSAPATESAKPQPVVAPPPPRPAPPAPIAAPPAPPKPVVAPAPAPAVAKPAPASTAAVNTAAAAAALAAAAAAQRIQTPAPAPAAPVPATPLVLPAAASTSGQGSAAAPIALDDLTLIRDIDRTLQARLNALGVRRYAEMAEWRMADVARFNEALGFKGRIEQENWIEQAHILAKGGETFYSRRRLRGEVPAADPTADEGARPEPTARAVPDTVNGSPTVIAPPSRAPAAAPATAATPPSAAAASGVGAAIAAAAAAAAAQRPAASLGRDNLQRISGISGEVEKLLNVQGVSRYAQISGWSAADVGRFDRLLGVDGRIAKDNWIEQAQILARGGETAQSREFDRRSSEAVGEARRPARLADAIRDQAREKGTTAAPSDAGTARGRSDLSALRSVRSEAYRTPEAAAQGPVVVPAGSPLATAAAAAAAATAAAAAAGAAKPASGPSVPVSAIVAARSRAGTPDDLKRIRGVGVLIEKKLNSLGVMTYDQIANWSSAEIERVSHILDFKGRIERENWVEQARILSAGGQTEFSRRVDRGEVETSRPKTE